jgi:hypothetical protein
MNHVFFAKRMVEWADLDRLCIKPKKITPESATNCPNSHAPFPAMVLKILAKKILHSDLVRVPTGAIA